MSIKRIAITDDTRMLRCRLLVQLIEICGAEPVLIPRKLKPSAVGKQRYSNQMTVKKTVFDQALSDHLGRVRSLLEMSDAMILPGNKQDVHPSVYGERTIHPETKKRFSKNPLNVRLQTEILMSAYATKERPIPLLGICGGFQVTNVVLGGTLIQHLPEHPRTKESDLPHRDPSLANINRHQQKEWEHKFEEHILDDVHKNIFPETHPMKVEKDSMLGQIYLKTNPKIDLNAVGELSIHHQGAFQQNLAKPLRAVAMAPDGVIEAAEHKNHPMCLLTQFHPECNVSGIAKPLLEMLLARA